MDHFQTIAEWCAAILESIGIAIILGISLHALLAGSYHLIQEKRFHATVGEVRERLGQGILLGLEFLIGADIIHTVAIELNLENVAVLGLIVLVRTFLSFTLEAELTGRWPWQGEGGGKDKADKA